VRILIVSADILNYVLANVNEYCHKKKNTHTHTMGKFGDYPHTFKI